MGAAFRLSINLRAIYEAQPDSETVMTFVNVAFQGGGAWTPHSITLVAFPYFEPQEPFCTILLMVSKMQKYDIKTLGNHAIGCKLPIIIFSLSVFLPPCELHAESILTRIDLGWHVPLGFISALLHVLNVLEFDSILFNPGSCVGSISLHTCEDDDCVCLHSCTTTSLVSLKDSKIEDIVG